MNRLSNGTLMLVPNELLGGILLLFLALGGICLIVGAKKAATGLITTAIALPFVTVVVEALLTEFFAVLPTWLVPIVAWFVMAIVYIAIFGALMSFLFGEHVWSEAKGHLLADCLKALLRFSFSAPMLVVWGILGFYIWLKG